MISEKKKLCFKHSTCNAVDVAFLMMLSLLSSLLKLPRFEKAPWFTFDQTDLSL